MQARKRLDIGWTDLASGLAACVLARDGSAAAAAVERRFGEDALACLSVRSALDLYLDALALPAGAEALVSALTIPDMAHVLEAHGLVVVPVDVDPRTLAPSRDAWLAAASPRTRLALAAHLFGTRNALDDLHAIAREHGWLVLDDHAQSFAGDGFVGDPRADATFFSFGPIKTGTALGGGVVRVRDGKVLSLMRRRQALWPLQGRSTFASRIARYGVLKLLSARPCYTAYTALLAARGVDLDRAIHGAVRSFPGELLPTLRRRPSPALLALLRRRLVRGVGTSVAARTAAGERLRCLLAGLVDLPGEGADVHSYWVFPVLVRDPDGLIRVLRTSGFDATRVATLGVVTPERCRAPAATALLERLVYVPAYPELGERRLDELAALLRAHGARVP